MGCWLQDPIALGALCAKADDRCAQVVGGAIPTCAKIAGVTTGEGAKLKCRVGGRLEVCL